VISTYAIKEIVKLTRKMFGESEKRKGEGEGEKKGGGRVRE
jgi:hypothetical protein